MITKTAYFAACEDFDVILSALLETMKTASWSDKEKYSLAKRERRKRERKNILGCL